MRVDHRDYWSITTVFPVQREPGSSGFPGDQWIDDDDSGISLDQRHVRQIKSANLIDRIRHRKESLLGDQLRLTPQARIDRWRAVLVKEGVGIVVPQDFPVRIGNQPRIERGDETPLRLGEVGVVGER